MRIEPHILKAFGDTWNVEAESYLDSAKYQLMIRVRDKVTDYYFTSAIDMLSMRSGGSSSEEYIIEVLKSLGKQVEYERRQCGRHPATGKPIFEASMDYIAPPSFDKTYFNRQPPKPPENERKAISKYGRY